jgi:drug/metabolite transporter (DMT)-like permease
MNSMLPIFFIVSSNTLYHIIQKNIPSSVHQVASIIATYFISLLGSIIIFFLYPFESSSIKQSLLSIHWTSFVLGLTVIGVDVGYLLLYRTGSAISTTAVTNNIIVFILLLCIGITLLHEQISLIKGIGVLIGLCSIALLRL